MALGDFVGPLPLWGWIVAGGGGLFLYERHKNSSGSGGLFQGALTSASQNPGVDNPTANGQAAPTNDTWAQGAVQGLISQGYDPLEASTAISDYLTGTSDTDPKFGTIVSQALKTYGTPPAGIIGDPSGSFTAPVMNTPTAPVPSQSASSGSTSALNKTYKVKKGDTQKKIAAKFGITVHELEAGNPAIQPEGSKVHTGQTLNV